MSSFYPELKIKPALKDIQLLINGNWIDSITKEWVDNCNPATQEKLGKVPLCGANEVDQAVHAAHNAYSYWREVPFSQRALMMFRFQALIRENLDDIAFNLSLEQGKTLQEAKTEVLRGMEFVEHAASASSFNWGKSIENFSGGTDSFSLQQPLGVCAGISSFNFPALTPLWMYPLAIATGNTFVLKPSEKAPSTANMLADLALHAGLPKGVLNVVHGGKSAVNTLLEHPLVKAVSFGGSPSAGCAIYKKGWEKGKRVQSFPGAKNHTVVLPDANKGNTLEAIIQTAFGSSGQRYMSLPAIIFVNETKNWIPELIDKARSLIVGPGLDPKSHIGPLISPKSKQRLTALIEEGVKEGAQLLLDGRTLSVPGHEKGNFIGPTIFSHVSREMEIYQKEIYGPALLLFESTSLDHAISIINNTPYRSESSLFTESGHHARHFQHFVDSGQVGINLSAPTPPPSMSFTGSRGTLPCGLHASDKQDISFYTQTKTISAKWFGTEHPDADAILHTPQS